MVNKNREETFHVIDPNRQHDLLDPLSELEFRLENGRLGKAKGME